MKTLGNIILKIIIALAIVSGLSVAWLFTYTLFVALGAEPTQTWQEVVATGFIVSSFILAGLYIYALFTKE